MHPKKIFRLAENYFIDSRRIEGRNASAAYLRPDSGRKGIMCSPIFDGSLGPTHSAAAALSLGAKTETSMPWWVIVLSVIVIAAGAVAMPFGRALDLAKTRIGGAS